MIIRASYGEHTDKKFEYFADKCEQLKIPYGVYCYDYALNDEQARAEAEYICSLVKGRNIQMGICSIWRMPTLTRRKPVS